jgi:2-keto-3-deoxy-L-rhamnonate aldolase RhmA
MMNKEQLKQQLAEGKLTYGMMLSEFYVPNITRMIANCGYDFLLVDCEHGYFDMTQVANLIAVADGVGLPILVRVTQPSRTMITKYLDMGARGILLSDVANAREAGQLAELCLYAPKGNRGISTFRAHTGYKNGDTKEIMRMANDCMIVICQIESPEAVADIDNIVAIDGIDGVLVGPNDLTQHMGIFEQFEHPNVEDALNKIEAAAKAAGKWSGVITNNKKLVRHCKDIGMTCFSVGSELNALVNGAMMQMETLKKL